jgi:hypothetical protein
MATDRLADVTCWLGHEIPQEEWTRRSVRLADGREVDRYETRCGCGESIVVYMDGGLIIEEIADWPLDTTGRWDR